MKIKGTSLKSALSYIQQTFGDEKLSQVLAALPPPEQAALSKLVLASDWYPFQTYQLLLTAMDRVLGQGDEQICRACGRFDAEYDLNKVYKIFYRLGAPLFIIGNAPLVWRSYYDSGRVEVEKINATRVKLQIREADEYARVVCREMEGWMERTIELSGGRQVKAEETQCRARGAAWCEYLVNWE